ncbi:hypothetical protein Talka_00416 [Tepidimonas alkaliphilus]|uniref:Single-stranded DNA-binding protein n=1 Tax=Tepidimonas alkaliphilus TaxID=2588942 RepID=A0A554WAZ1_9BURK|nr:single-stranded DNA-binding protein [Tepidimonas alkaliphilus]TSE20753.1 hypothetical protein Talka_00416 [Tepidimonas alkaliphilus]
MAIDALIQGRLHGDPVRRETKTGRAYATARLAVTDGDGGQHLVSAIAFDADVVQQLLALCDGDALAAAGELSASTFTAKTGEVRPSLRLLVHAILTPYTVRRRREAATDRRDGGTHTTRTPDRQRRHSAALRAQQPLPDDDLGGLPL